MVQKSLSDNIKIFFQTVNKLIFLIFVTLSEKKTFSIVLSAELKWTCLNLMKQAEIWIQDVWKNMFVANKFSNLEFLKF